MTFDTAFERSHAPNTTNPTLERCPLCGRRGKIEEFFIDNDPQPWYVATCEVCPVKTYDQTTPEEAARIWNTRVSANVVAPTVGVPELDSDDDLTLIADAINVARQVQEFIWGGCYPALRPYDAEGWRRLFQKRVDCIANVDLTRHGGLAMLRKRLLQQAALSVKALALVNRWAKAYPHAVTHKHDGADGVPSPTASTVAPVEQSALGDRRKSQALTIL